MPRTNSARYTFHKYFNSSFSKCILLLKKEHYKNPSGVSQKKKYIIDPCRAPKSPAIFLLFHDALSRDGFLPCQNAKETIAVYKCFLDRAL